MARLVPHDSSFTGLANGTQSISKKKFCLFQTPKFLILRRFLAKQKEFPFLCFFCLLSPADRFSSSKPHLLTQSLCSIDQLSSSKGYRSNCSWSIVISTPQSKIRRRGAAQRIRNTVDRYRETNAPWQVCPLFALVMQRLTAPPLDHFSPCRSWLDCTGTVHVICMYTHLFYY